MLTQLKLKKTLQLQTKCCFFHFRQFCCNFSEWNCNRWWYEHSSVNVIKPKRSETPNQIPVASALTVHELAMNVTDKIIY